jgi:uncharacterized membrane protein YqjE
MATEVRNGSETGVGSLVKDVVSDVGTLVGQQLQFAKVELRGDFKRTLEASTLLVSGVITAFVGVLLLGHMLARLLHWLTFPAGVTADPATLPLWACYGIAGFVMLALGGLLAWRGKKNFDSFNPLPDKTAETLKENVEWMTNANSK